MSDRFPAPTEAMEFLARKGIVESESWDDLKHGEHSHAFTVAHSVNGNIVTDIHRLLLEYQQDGRTIRDFQADMQSLMEARNWYGGRADKGPEDEDYIKWRIKMIYRTNMRTAASAGRTRQMLRSAESRPWWVYKSLVTGDNRREAHLSLHDTAYRYDDSFWDVYDPPNGWGCECYKVSMSDHQIERGGIPKRTIQDVPGDFRDSVPQEWRYSPGREALAPDFGRYERLRNMDTPDGRRAIKAVRKHYAESIRSTAMTQGEWDIWVRRAVERGGNPQRVLVAAASLSPTDHGKIERHIGEAIDTKVMADDHDALHSLRDTKPTVKKPSVDQLSQVHATLTQPDAVYQDKQDPNTFHFVAALVGDKGEKVIDVVVRRYSEITSLRIRTIKVARLSDVQGGGTNIAD